MALLAFSLSGPLAAPLLGVQGTAGLHGWQWLFLVKGTASVVVGVFAFFWLNNSISDTTWLTGREKAALTTALDDERRAVAESYRGERPRWCMTMRDPRIVVLTAIYFTVQMSIYANTFWLASIVRGMGDLSVRFLSSIPWVCAFGSMFLLARIGDRTGRRRMWLVGALFAAAFGSLGAAYAAPALAPGLPVHRGDGLPVDQPGLLADRAALGSPRRSGVRRRDRQLDREPRWVRRPLRLWSHRGTHGEHPARPGRARGPLAGCRGSVHLGARRTAARRTIERYGRSRRSRTGARPVVVLRARRLIARPAWPGPETPREGATGAVRTAGSAAGRPVVGGEWSDVRPGSRPAARWWRPSLLVVLVAATAGVALSVGVPSVAEIRGWIGGAGWAGPLAWAAVYAALSLTPVPVSALAVAGGVLFGLNAGLPATLAGKPVGAAIGFALARRLGRAAVVGWLDRRGRGV
ncbi:MFS transporter [Pseudonocardia nematodicida]|uniref:MFS transporter n=1 Tax=Pseudonocardia nematodicida TaxID=1206997 RepID=A0ABV1KE66_9PSEU